VRGKRLARRPSRREHERHGRRQRLLHPGPVRESRRASLSAGAPPVGAAPSITAGAYTPDWAKLISSDPGLLDAQNALLAGSAGDLASRNALIQRALVNFGSVPDLATLAKQLGLSQEDLSGLAGSDVQRLAQENTDAGLSTQARLAQANQDAIRQLTNQLNARGLLNSGESAYELDRQDTGYRQAQSDATQKLLDYLNQYQQGYASAQAQRAQALASAYGSAADRQFASNQGSAGTAATWAFTDANGAHVYRGPDGTLYNADGSVYNGPGGAPPTSTSLAPPVAPTTPKPPTYGGSGGGRPTLNL
jgi:hypothetical protein